MRRVHRAEEPTLASPASSFYHLQGSIWNFSHGPNWTSKVWCMKRRGRIDNRLAERLGTAVVGMVFVFATKAHQLKCIEKFPSKEN